MTDSGIDGRTRLVGLLGWPVEHSASPAMHNAAFSALDLNYRYLPLPVTAGALPGAIEGLRALGFRGANVTIPHKQSVLDLVDEVSVAARSIGAANLLVVGGGGSILADNTDAAGFLGPLAQCFSQLAGRRIAVLGAGGAARAVGYALAGEEATPVFYARRGEQARAVCRDLCSIFPRVAIEAGKWDALGELGAETVALIQTTPVGMWPDVESSPWPVDLALPSELVVYDLIYNPPRTALLRRALASGCTVIDGRRMLVEQAALSFQAWTGVDPARSIMAAACDRVLGVDGKASGRE